MLQHSRPLYTRICQVALGPACLLLVLASLAACTPKYDWRDVRGASAPYTVLLPSKPSTHARPVNLGGIQANMTMTAAEVDDVTFAVATAELPDAAQAQAALLVMKETMIKNIAGVVRKEKAVLGTTRSTIDLDAGPAPAVTGSGTTSTVGSTATTADSGRNTGKALHARFVARERRVYQVMVVGPEKSISQEAVDTFLTSFKID